ncbi:hypothetical protein R9C26_002082 [Enterobacter hormaechei]|nr:hypothetical protein [Enterobacter hormaechei]ELT6448397.1 hypothetical protein [Enterobacter hormaechei]EMF0735483.1 hypothetical protein [Enterobacter hormaechei]
MKKECGYCRKPFEAGKEVKRTLLYFCGNNLARKKKSIAQNSVLKKTRWHTKRN